MNILIPMNGDKNSEGICPSFARAPYFMIWDTETGREEFVRNAATDSPSGAGVKAAQIVVDLNPDIVLAPRLGKNAADVIKAQNIKIYKSVSDDANSNIELYLQGKIDELTEIHPGFHQQG